MNSGAKPLLQQTLQTHLVVGHVSHDIPSYTNMIISWLLLYPPFLVIIFWFVALLLRILQIPRGYDSLWPQGGALVHKDAEHNSNN